MGLSVSQEELSRDIEELVGCSPDPFAQLAGLPRWVAWHFEGTRKIARPPTGSRRASSTDPADWATRARATDRAADLGDRNKLGLILGPVAPGPCIGGVDLDGALDEFGDPEPWAQAVLDRFNSYAELSPSGGGLKVYFIYNPDDMPRLRESFPSGEWGASFAVNHVGPELHLGGRWYAVTGRHFAGTPTTFERAGLPDLLWLLDELGPKVKAQGGGGKVDRSAALFAIACQLQREGATLGEFMTAAMDDPHARGHVDDNAKGERARTRLLTRQWERAGSEVTARDDARIAALEDLDGDAPSTPARLLRTSRGEVTKSLHNAGVFLQRVLGDRRLRWNLLGGCAEMVVDDTPRRVDDHDLATLRVAIERAGLHPIGKDLVADAARMVARADSYHPVQEHLEALPLHDGLARLDTWLTDYLGVQDTPYSRAVGRKFLIAMVARPMLPGCKVDNMLVLGGAQDIGKSTVCAILADKPEWFLDALPDIGKDGGDPAMKALRGKWVVEVGEMVATRKSEQEDLKAFLSRQVDDYRIAYDREQTSAPRQCVLIGTTNRREFLRDDTGDRRYWPVWCEGPIRLEALKRDRVQLFAEALAAFKRGELWYLDKAEAALAREVQAAFAESDTWQDTIASVLAGRCEIAMSEVLWEGLGIPVERQNRVTQLRAAAAMRRLGWEKGHGRRGKRWIRKDALETMIPCDPFDEVEQDR